MKIKKLLVIVDDWERLERYEDRLHRLFEFHSSPFGGHGVEMAIEHQPDIILIDLEFEDMSGEEALELIQAQDSLRGAEIILVSHASSLEGKNEKVRVFQRPISLSQLQAFLETLRKN